MSLLTVRAVVAQGARFAPLQTHRRRVGPAKARPLGGRTVAPMLVKSKVVSFSPRESHVAYATSAAGGGSVGNGVGGGAGGGGGGGGGGGKSGPGGLGPADDGLSGLSGWQRYLIIAVAGCAFIGLKAIAVATFVAGGAGSDKKAGVEAGEAKDKGGPPGPAEATIPVSPQNHAQHHVQKKTARDTTLRIHEPLPEQLRPPSFAFDSLRKRHNNEYAKKNSFVLSRVCDSSEAILSTHLMPQSYASQSYASYPHMGHLQNLATSLVYGLASFYVLKLFLTNFALPTTVLCGGGYGLSK